MSDTEPDNKLYIHTTQCCGATVWIYTDYSQGGELMIPICFSCKQKVTLEGEIINE
tara:strand:- start:102 stop:269 length:168 start_codon:yes stop_codon:yes gene_type:complete